MHIHNRSQLTVKTNNLAIVVVYTLDHVIIMGDQEDKLFVNAVANFEEQQQRMQYEEEAER